MKQFFVPLGTVSRLHMRVMLLFQVILFGILWVLYPSTFFPKPWEIAQAWMKLMNDGFLLDIGTSLRITIEAICITTILSLGFVYLSVFPWFRPWIKLISKFRFNGLVGVTLFSHSLQVVAMS